MEATTTRASTVMRSIPTREIRTHASMTMPLSSTRSRTSIRLDPPDSLSTAISAPPQFLHDFLFHLLYLCRDPGLGRVTGGVADCRGLPPTAEATPRLSAAGSLRGRHSGIARVRFAANIRHAI